jgi:hypothetical protein
VYGNHGIYGICGNVFSVTCTFYYVYKRSIPTSRPNLESIAYKIFSFRRAIVRKEPDVDALSEGKIIALPSFCRHHKECEIRCSDDFKNWKLEEGRRG